MLRTVSVGKCLPTISLIHAVSVSLRPKVWFDDSPRYSMSAPVLSIWSTSATSGPL